MRVQVRGTIYESVAEAAEKLNVTRSAVYTSAQRGTLETLGLGPGNRTNHEGCGRPKQPVTIAGIYFSSMIDASRELRMSASYVQGVLTKGSEIARQDLIVRVMRYKAEQNKQASKAKQSAA